MCIFKIFIEKNWANITSMIFIMNVNAWCNQIIDHSLIMRLQTLVYVVTWDACNLICI